MRPGSFLLIAWVLIHAPLSASAADDTPGRIVASTYSNDKPQKVVTYKDPETKKIRILEELFYMSGGRQKLLPFQNNVLHGKGANWYPDGRKAAEIDYVNGEMRLFQGWSENGAPHERSEWAYGGLHGVCLQWDKDRNEYRSVWSRGKMQEGAWVDDWYWTERKSTQTQMDSQKPILHTLGSKRHAFESIPGGGWRVMEWYASGRRKSLHHLLNGKQNGPSVTWYESGETEVFQNFKDGELDGIVTAWHENGFKKREGMWRDGVPIGNPSAWDERGNRIESEDVVLTFRDSNFRFRMPELPWTKIDPASIRNDAKIALVRPKPNLCFFLVPAEMRLKPGFDPGRLDDIAIEHYKKTSKNFRLTEKGPYTRGELNGTRMIFETDANGKPTYYAAWYCFYADILYQLHVLTEDRQSKDALPEALDGMVDLFEVMGARRETASEAAPRQRPIEEYISKPYGYSISFKNAKVPWTSMDFSGQKMTAVDFAAKSADGTMVFLVVPVRLYDIDPSLDDLTPALVAQLKVMEYPNPYFKISGRKGGGDAEEMTIEYHRETNGNDPSILARVVRRKSYAYLFAGIAAQKIFPEARRHFSDLLSRVEPASSGKWPSVSTDLDEKQMRKNAVVLSDIGAGHYFAKRYGKSLPYIQKAFELNPDDPGILKNVIEVLMQMQKFEDALSLLQREIPNFPENQNLIHSRAVILTKLNNDTNAVGDYEKLHKDIPGDESIALEFAAALWKTNRKEQAFDILEKFADLSGSIKTTLFLAQLRRVEKQHDAAISLLSRLRGSAQTRWPAPEIGYELIENYYLKKDYLKSIEISETLIRDFPESSDAHFFHGRSELALKRNKNAKASFEKALALNPYSDAAKQFLQIASTLLGQGDNSSLKTDIPAVAYAADIRFDQILKKSAKAAASPDFADYNSAYLLRLKAVQFERGSVLKSTIRQINRINNQEGMADFGELVFDFDPLRQEVFVNHLHVYDAEGKQVATGQVDDYYVMHKKVKNVASDDKRVHVPVPGAAPGHFVDVMITFKDHLNDTLPFDRYYMTSLIGIPVIENIYAIQGDVDAVAYSVAGMDGPKSENRALIFRTDRPQILYNESFLPPLEEFLPVVTVSSKLTWRDEVNRYIGRIKDILEGDKDLESTAAEIVKGCATNTCKALRLARHVQRSINYQAIEFGEHAQIPTPPAKTLKQKYGDCKDYSILLYTLLKNVGILSNPALVHSREKINHAVPSLNQFNHMILHVPLDGLDRYFDCTNKYSDDLYPVKLSGQEVLPIFENNDQFKKIPMPPEAAGKILCTRQVRLEEGLDLVVREQILLDGHLKEAVREMLSGVAKPDWKDIMVRFLTKSNDRLQVENLEIQNYENFDSPLGISATYGLDDQFEQLPDGFVGRLPALWENAHIRIDTLDKRRHPFEREYPLIVESDVSLEYPKGYELKPGDVLKASQGRLPHLQWDFRPVADARDNRVRWTARYEILPVSLQAEDYNSYRESLAKSADALTPKMIFLKEKQ